MPAQDAAALPPPTEEAAPPPQETFAPPPQHAPDAPPSAQQLAPEVQDQLIHMKARTVARVQSQTGPFTVRVGGALVGQQVVVEDEQVPVLGRSQTPLEWTEFYDAVGRPDLAKSYARRSLGKAGMFLVGLALSVGSGLFLLAGMVPGMGLIFWRTRVEGTQSPQPTNPFLLGGIGLILLGALAMTVAILAGSTILWLSTRFTPDVATAQENLALMEEHNARVVAPAGSPAPQAGPEAPPQQ